MESVILAPDLFVQQLLPSHGTLVAMARQTVDSVDRKTEPIGLVADSKLKRSIDVTLLLVATDMEIVLALAAVSETVNEPWVRVEVEDDWLVVREDGTELFVGQAMRMLMLWNELEEIDNVDETDLELGSVRGEVLSRQETRESVHHRRTP